MSLGLKKWNDCLPFVKAFFEVFDYERIIQEFLSASKGQQFNTSVTLWW